MRASVVQLLVIFVFHSIFLLCHSSMQFTRSFENDTERLALLAIKAKIEHDPNLIMSTWNHSTHFCLWYGVTCGGRRHPQRVTKLNISSQGLVGSISPHIGNLSFLREVLLYNNSFTHEIPPQIGRLRRLQRLVLLNNSFTGPIPANISNCFNLLFIQLSGNKLVGEIPSRLGFLSKLQFLSLGYNNLTGVIPSTLGNLTSLTRFYVLSNNNLVGSIPASLGKLKNLEVLSLGGNRLSGTIPASLGQLKKLTVLLLGVNRLSGIIPPSIYNNLSAIESFYLPENQLQGSIPSYLSNAFPNLQIFEIGVNKFTGKIPLSISNATSLVLFGATRNSLFGQVPNLHKLHKLTHFGIAANLLGSGKNGDLNFISELINATQLKLLQIDDNNFGGTLPTSISNLSTSNLKLLTLGGNQLHGSIPSKLGNLVNLQCLYMDDNSFTGSIPTSIGKLSRLGELYLHNNHFSGSIPSSLGNLTMLSRLYLQRNNLKGSIPLSLAKCQGLQDLDVSQNNLDGNIPQQLLGDLISFSISLNLSTNHFTGSLPVEIGRLKSLGALDISVNQLSGELPNSLGSCESLEVLYLQGNSFEGNIPFSMKGLRGLKDLDLSRNNFSGEIPKFLEGLVLLKNLNLSFNEFSGAIPIEGVFKNASETSVVGNIHLCGGIAELGLPVCKSKRRGLSHRLKILISLACVSSLIGSVMMLSVFFLHKKKKKETTTNNSGNSMLQISYATLLKATDHFSSSNLIGMGAFGSVYNGVLEDGVVVAVKVFNMLHRGASKSFIAECEALRNIRHRNLVKIITACSSIDFLGNDFKALVYEFMDNGSLEEWLHPSTGADEVVETPKVLSLVQRLDISIDVACALDYLHNHCETPIVHCDLKPSNVLLDKEMTGHVSDFGLARFLSDQTDNASGNQSSSIGIRGSVGYAAPEYGMGSDVSTNGDIYSFGILLLEMFTGKRPTDNMFNDGLNLHNFVKTNLPERVLEIAAIGDVTEAPNQSSLRPEKVEECLNMIFEIGITCSTQSPANRKDMSDVVSELHTIRASLLG